MSSRPAPGVLFVCLGNICRSPIAEGVCRARADAAGLSLRIDSAGTGPWHIGKPPDPRAIRVAGAHGYDLRSQRARQVEAADFLRFDWIVAMDAANHAALARLAGPAARARLSLLLEYGPDGGGDVPDPYAGDDADFEQVLRLVEPAVDGLLLRIRECSP